MGCDLFLLKALADELNCALGGARIDKIQQPEADELRFTLRAGGKNDCLLISCNSSSPRMHLTASKKPVPKVAPNLCMLLRKHLSCAYIDKIGVYADDRILYVRFNAKTELKDDAAYFMFVEIMNRYSNIVFTDENLTILDAVKHLPLEADREHIVVRGVKYLPVSQRKTSYLISDFAFVDNFKGGDAAKFLLDNISGFSLATATEALFRAGVPTDSPALSPAAAQRLKDVLKQFAGGFAAQPNIVNGNIFPMRYGSVSGEATDFPTLSAALDALYTDIDRQIRNKARLKGLATQAKRLTAKAQKNIAIDLERLAECENMDKYRLYGQLIVNNIYKIKRGDASVVCEDYIDGGMVEIPLDVALTPSKNSAAYFAKYNKLKRTKEFTQKKLEADKELLSYALSIEEEIASLPYDADCGPIVEELSMLGGAKQQSKKDKQRKPKADPPYVYQIDGFYIYKGKNNIQNDELTFKIASSDDIWLHLKNEPGAHTVIVTEGRNVPEKVLKIAAEIAASSKQATSDVDYTERKNVKRKPGGHPGQVIYVAYKTLHVFPDAHSEFLLQK